MILKPSNIDFDIDYHFPKLSWGKVGIALSGGLESTLIAKIAMEHYGEDKVVLLYSDNMFTASNEETNERVRSNVNNAAQLLGKPVNYFDVDTKLHFTDMEESVRQFSDAVEKFYGVEFTLWGFTKLFFDVSEFKENSSADHDYVVKTCYGNPKKYQGIIQEFHLPTNLFTEYVKDLDIPDMVYKMLRSDIGVEKLKRPFDTLNKSEVIDLYRNLGYLDLAYKTRSCIDKTLSSKYKHCGKCFNCQQRYDAFAKLEIDDLTEYESDFVKSSWQKLKLALKDFFKNVD